MCVSPRVHLRLAMSHFPWDMVAALEDWWVCWARLSGMCVRLCVIPTFVSCRAGSRAETPQW